MTETVCATAKNDHKGPVDSAVSALRAGSPIVITDRAGSADAAVVFLAAALADAHWTSWLVKNSSGLLFAPLLPDRADALGLPPMITHPGRLTLGCTVSVDAATGIGTGISATDRSRTARVLADPESTRASVTRPGHVIPVRADGRGVLGRTGFDEAGIDLCVLAGLAPVGLLSDLINVDGSASTSVEATVFAQREGCCYLDLQDVIDDRLRRGTANGGRVTHIATEPRTYTGKTYTVRTYLDNLTGTEHMAISAPGNNVPSGYIVHTECTSSDTFDRIECRCEQRLLDSLQTIARRGGTVVFLRRETFAAPSNHVSQALQTSVLEVIAADLAAHPIVPNTSDTTLRMGSEKQSLHDKGNRDE